MMTLAVAGATGTVGRELLRVLEESNVLGATPALLASGHSVGEAVPYRSVEENVTDLAQFDFKKAKIALFAVPPEVAKVHVPRALAAGAFVIDASGAFRAESETIGRGLNDDALRAAQKKRLVTTPSPLALALATVLKPLHKSAGVKRLVVSTYQSTSGAGKQAMDELFRQSTAMLGGAGAGDVENETFEAQLAFNVLPKVGTFQPDGATSAEKAFTADLTHLMGVAVPVSATCVHVPTFIGEGQSVNVEFSLPMTAAKARDILGKVDGVAVIDNPKSGEYATPYGAAETTHVFVSRIRDDGSAPNTLNLWVVADNLRTGCAQNMVWLAERVASEIL
jgi:aspartate-semialdehyde dehydrogenase